MWPETSSPIQMSKVEPEPSGALEAPAEKSHQVFLELGIPEEWVEPLMELGYDTVDKLRAEEKPGRLHQNMMGYRKKNRLEIGTVTMEQVSEWIS